MRQILLKTLERLKIIANKFIFCLISNLSSVVKANKINYMFNDLNLDSNQKGDKKVDDIFAEIDTNTPTPPQTSNIKSQVAGLSAHSQTTDTGEVVSHDKKKTGMLIILILAIIILGAAVYLVYTKLMQPTSENNLINNQDQVKEIEKPIIKDNDQITPEPEEEDNNMPGVEDEIITPSPGQPTVPEVPAELDSDGDVLTDAEEAKLGTNPLNRDTDGDVLTDYDEIKIYNTNPLIADTDGDGLTDYDEIMIYKTDPLNPDTDGDGYSDGEEVGNGYNPLGDGPLQTNL